MPSFMADLIIRTAIGPWPWPNEIDLNLEPPMFLSLANLSKPRRENKRERGTRNELEFQTLADIQALILHANV